MPRGDRQIFLCDASAEAGRLLTALQTKGYSVADVPLGLLVSRCRHELPEVILCDADAHEAETRLVELSQLALPELKFVLFGQLDGALARTPRLKQLAHESFVRPLDLEVVMEHISAICSPPRRRSHRPRVGRSGLMPSLVTAARKPYRSDAQFFDTSPQAFEKEEPSDVAWPSDPPPNRRMHLSDPPHSADRVSQLPALKTSVPMAPSTSQYPLSPETMSVLEMGRRKLEAYPKQSARPVRLSMGAQSIACDLRPGLLAALEEPLDDTEYGARFEDDLPDSTSPGTRNTRTRHNTSTGLAQQEWIDSAPPGSPHTLPPAGSARFHAFNLDLDEETNPGGRAGGTHPPPEASEHAHKPLAQPVELPGIEDLSDLLSSPWNAPPPEFGSDSEPVKSDLNTTQPPRHPQAQRVAEVELDSLPVDAEPSSSDLSGDSFLDAPSIPASLFGQRQAIDRLPTDRQPRPSLNRTQKVRPLAGPRTSPQASQLSDLLARCIRERFTGAVAQQNPGGIRRVLLTDGDITTAISTIASESLAHFLNARGDITREILVTLSSIPSYGRHAGAALIARGLLQQEDLWPVLRAHAEWILGIALGSAVSSVIEDSVPQRLLDEPAVFGGAAGAEIYMEALRRVVTPEKAFVSLGGGERILGKGAHETLMSESALSQRDQQAAWEAAGHPLGPLMKRDPRLLPLLLGLTHLGVLTVGGGEVPLQVVDVHARTQEMDEQAFISKLMARRSLVDDGDYFQLLGIARSATGYEVDRARDELLSLFSEDRLTARTVHLRPDLHLLRITIEEAHLVLRDDVRRFRYRTALEAMPS